MGFRRSALILSLIVLCVGLTGCSTASSLPPVTDALQDGRDHKTEGTTIVYQTNPPTSGDHYFSWTTKGFYQEPRYDGNIVHSLEHGYVDIHYNCEVSTTSFQVIPPVAAQESLTLAQRAAMTVGSEGSPSAKIADLPEKFRNGSCDRLKNDLRQLYDKNNHKVIIVPRPGIDSPIVLTAWGKYAKLTRFDKDKIDAFIRAYRDKGPEKTIEP